LAEGTAAIRPRTLLLSGGHRAPTTMRTDDYKHGRFKFLPNAEAVLDGALYSAVGHRVSAVARWSRRHFLRKHDAHPLGHTDNLLDTRERFMEFLRIVREVY